MYVGFKNDPAQLAGFSFGSLEGLRERMCADRRARGDARWVRQVHRLSRGGVRAFGSFRAVRIRQGQPEGRPPIAPERLVALTPPRRLCSEWTVILPKV